MVTVVAVYTGQGLSERIGPLFREELPGCRLVNIIDDSLIADVIQAGEVTTAVIRRLVQYYRHAEDIGADLILNTCSSVGEVADRVRPLFNIPIVKIDDDMARQATMNFNHIGVLATLPTTLEPTRQLLQREAVLQNRKVHVVDALAEGAYQALVSGQPEEHDRLIFEAAKSVASKADVLVLAQGSMARMEKALSQETGLPVYASPRLGLMAVRAELERQGKYPC
ncbi:aspartate/glutamate racemase family protein [Paenibacillus aceris]|uniref:Aspartate/glutamate racemase n=1 Tax=Paenibacillus aceris TaxID=869555 RepID=A0ABS4HWB8_9BACL|nr:aspartate/glutamate racemase family protein [Paenibacillus aceris]MBP1962843.1 aspartate/glutamate racemase [Paenibacillus aceris]NHW38271.1 aspartate/glutamate racemase family protein [Paenibacillus aceris]